MIATSSLRTKRSGVRIPSGTPKAFIFLDERFFFFDYKTLIECHRNVIHAIGQSLTKICRFSNLLFDIIFKRRILEHMMELDANNIADVTQYLIREYYNLNTGPLFSVLAEDCVWLGPGNLLVFGAKAIKTQFKNGFIMPAFKMVNPHFYILDTGSKNHIVVLGEYLLFSDENADLICASKQRITFCYILE